ncbi:hypothetical protein FRC10_001057 [Ceratobasidium sp. 414]|nr:hypothetical protein FRC10_001057 [Ceratobasidium sp. 414]
MRLAAVFMLVIFVFGQFCVAVPFIADTIRRSFASVHVQHPGRLQNVPVAQLGVPYAFQLDLNTFTVVDSDSGAPLKVPPVVALDPDSNIPHWISFDPDKLVFSGTPDVVPESSFRIRLIATALESGDQNDTAFDLYVSDTAPPSVISSLEHQHNMDLMILVNASRLATKPGVWIHPGSMFTIQVDPFCNVSSANSSLYYSAYHPSNSSFGPLPEWLHFDNTTLALTGTSPIEPTSIHVLFRCSNIYGAGGPEQTLFIDVTEHEVELGGAPFAFELTPSQPFEYNFQWVSDQLWIDGDSARGRKLLYSNGSHFPLGVNTSGGDIGLSFSLDNYPWLYFDNINTTIYGTPPPTKEPSLGLPSVPLNISYRGQNLETEIPVYSLGASPWASSRDAGVVIFPDREFFHNFTLDLIDSVRSDPRWNIYVQINDPFNESSWLNFGATTHVLDGTVPAGSPSRNIDIRVTNWVPPPVQHVAWSSTSVTVAIALVIIILLLLMFIFMLYGLWHGWLVSPILLYRRRYCSSQTLVDSSLEIGAGSCKPVRLDGIQVHVEQKVETTEAPNMDRPVPAAQVEHDINGPVLLVVPSALSSPTSATTPSTLTACSASASSAPSSLGPSSPRIKSPTSQGLRATTFKQSSSKGKFRLFRKRAAFGKDSTEKHAQKPAIVVSAVSCPRAEPNEAPFTPLWKGHVYQTPGLLNAEEDAWKVRRLDRKARLKREYFVKKEAKAQGRFVDVSRTFMTCSQLLMTFLQTRFPAPKENEDDAPRPGAPRRFGIFEQLAKMEDLDRRGPANMRGDVPRSRLVEVGENRFFNDTMVDRSEVGSSEFSSLASWETLSESSLPDMVLCYGQLGRRRARAGDALKTPRAPIDPWDAGVFAGPVYREEGSLPEPDDETVTDENLLDRLARSLGSELSLDEHGDEINFVSSQIESESRGLAGGVTGASLVKWKGKGIAWGEHGSQTTSQHSPTFKRLARQRFQASIDSTAGGSPLSKMAIARTLAHASPSSQSIATGASSDLSPSGSMASLVFHVNEQGVYYYVIPASTRFCFTARITKIDGEEPDDDKPTFGRAKAAVYGVQTDDPNEPSLPLWLHFNAPGLEFWGYAPNTDEHLQHAMKIVHRASGEVVGRLLVVVARLDDMGSAQAVLGYPTTVSGVPNVAAPKPPSSKLAVAINLACSPQISGIPPQSPRSIATSHTGTDFSSSGSMTAVVFHLARDGIDFFVIPANTQFCFEVPGLQTNATKSALGRAVASPYMIQVDETSEVVSIPQWLHFVVQSTEFWGEAPDVAECLRIGMKIVQRETGEVAMRVLIIVTRLDDVRSLQAELNYGRVMESDGLSVVEEVSSIDSAEDRIKSKDEAPKDAGSAGPKTPERSHTNISVSSSRRARSYRGTTRSQVGSKFSSPASRRSPGTGGRGGRMRTPVSARMGGYEDYDSVMFEGQSRYSGSLFGPELGTLAGGAISSGALEAMSRAASRAGSISLLPNQRTMVIAPTSMDSVEYYVIRGGADFCFTLQMPKGRVYGVEFEVDKEQEGWKAPEWIGVVMNEKAGTLEFSGSTHGLEEYEERAIVVLEGESGDKVKRVRVVVVPGVKA